MSSWLSLPNQPSLSSAQVDDSNQRHASRLFTKDLTTIVGGLLKLNPPKPPPHQRSRKLYSYRRWNPPGSHYSRSRAWRRGIGRGSTVFVYCWHVSPLPLVCLRGLGTLNAGQRVSPHGFEYSFRHRLALLLGCASGVVARVAAGGRSLDITRRWSPTAQTRAGEVYLPSSHRDETNPNNFSGVMYLCLEQ